jgi:hypothetical protein
LNAGSGSNGEPYPKSKSCRTRPSAICLAFSSGRSSISFCSSCDVFSGVA